tara:strand:+ start:531 stop:734 length:204 start_codon:yes stop_codon:yes gene_type:complete
MTRSKISIALETLNAKQFVIKGQVTNEDEYTSNVKWVVADNNGQAVFGTKPNDMPNWTAVKAEMDKL